MKDEDAFRNGKRLQFSAEQDLERALRGGKRLDHKRRRILGTKTSSESSRVIKDTRTREEYITSDDTTALAISEVFRSGGSVRLTGKLGPGVQYYGVNGSYKNKAERLNPSSLVEDISTVHIPRWQDTGPYLKTIAWVHGSLRYGSRARAFTLNLSEEVIRRACDNPQGFTSYLQKSLTRNLSRTYKRLGIMFEPSFFFWVEAHKKERPHLHGVIVLPEEAINKSIYKAIRRAIRLTGGDWTGSGHQLVVKAYRPENPFGWAWYSSKLKETSSMYIRTIAPHDDNPRLVGVSHALNRLSKGAYEDARQRGEILSGAASSKLSERQ